jgi:hypothetical protein
MAINLMNACLLSCVSSSFLQGLAPVACVVAKGGRLTCAVNRGGRANDVVCLSYARRSQLKLLLLLTRQWLACFVYAPPAEGGREGGREEG